MCNDSVAQHAIMSSSTSEAASSSVYKSYSDKAHSLSTSLKGPGRQKETIKEKINKLFNFGSAGDQSSSKCLKIDTHHESHDEADDFLPHPVSYTKRSKGKGKIGAETKVLKGKRKIKERRLRVVWVYPRTSTTPTDRAERFREVWVRADASASEIRDRIKDLFQWPEMQEYQYMYAQGKNLRVAKIGDIENSTSWDCETVRALMGSGYLYISKSFMDSLSDSEVSTSFYDHPKSIIKKFKCFFNRMRPTGLCN